MSSHSEYELVRNTPDASYHVPNDLSRQVLERFDALVENGEILYTPSDAELYDDNGFEFEFRQTTAFNKKPSTAANDPGRTSAVGPFINPRSSITILSRLGPKHRLLLNEFCVWRPMLLLTTAEYAMQTDDLDIDDISASLAVLNAFKAPFMMIYNCGVSGGSSQGHKHMQLHPQPEKSRLFMSLADSAETISDRIPGVPYQHFVLQIPSDATPGHVLRAYQRLLRETKASLQTADAGEGYNVVMTRDWIGLIPRRIAKTKDASDVFGINAAGMMGLITVRSEHERQRWKELGYGRYLARLGIPISGEQ
ncbi:putative 5',5'''-P-1,P-4-tetraphosphate phosphorylase [Myriangium duriaei CBS 260.36]|uniref:5',5'''-P-1,P-4-tetraphosphate phosphorylase n=1 Tax=Myriangium duriaei CBS 260.36 TaxID=1168546 RepID=A0A9P4IWI2_9PEZI|nr:putative 5',5'''-P-1,P-4-tetraphosphate phosphorylase [Myriangium duriaei CBS 260.36]